MAPTPPSRLSLSLLKHLTSPFVRLVGGTGLEPERRRGCAVVSLAPTSYFRRLGQAYSTSLPAQARARIVELAVIKLKQQDTIKFRRNGELALHGWEQWERDH